LFSSLYILIFALCYFSVLSEEKNKGLRHKSRTIYSAAIGLCGLFVVQLVLAATIPGHKQDIGLFTQWAAFSESHPIWEYYTTELYVDYPPVYLYVLYLVGSLARLFRIPSDSAQYLSFIKFVPILFDAMTTIFIFRFARSRLGDKKALALAFLSAVNPMNIVNSTIWGQVDSVTTLLCVLMLLFLYQRKYVSSCLLFALLFLTKPQMIIFAPVLGFVFLFDIIEARGNKQDFRHMLRQAGLSVLAAALVLLIVPLPITGGRYGLLLENYQKALGLYPYATLNAANLHALFGGNWVQDTAKVFIFSYKIWGFICIVALSLFVGYVAWHRRDREKIFALGALMASGIYMLAHNMHERYIYPTLLLLIFVYIITGDKKNLLFYAGFSLTGFISCAWVLILNWQEGYIYGNNLAFRLLAAANVALFILWVYHAFFAKATLTQPQATPAKKQPGRLKIEQSTYSLQEQAAPVRLVRLDYLLMLGLTLFYALFGFYRLGSTAVPETGWYPTATEEAVTLDMGESQDVSQLYLYTGWIDRRSTDHEVLRKLEILYSEDGSVWQPAAEPVELNAVFRWHVFRFEPVSCRYMRLVCDDGRFYINEAALFGATEADRRPIASVLSANETAPLLIDEQDKVRYEFSWYDGTYFDEVYHPRTAYEYIEGRYPYENTHPPLGKAIISCGILLFGMNPFGWRFFGTLCGVLMVPLVYIMGKKMLKKTTYAFAAAFIFSFDFMHLSQTRMATIDSYTAFFVMGMYLFMFLYIEKSFYHGGVRQTLLPLFLSGLCFGLGAATKWQGIYAGIGLAFLYFYSLGRRYMEYRQAMAHPSASDAARIVRDFKPMALQTVAAGFAFFVALPLVIYFLSYIPPMLTEGTDGIFYFFENQHTMLSYHSALEDTHPYSSSWWQWPFDYKPLYAYNPNRDFVPEGTSMGITSFGNPLIWWLTIPLVVWAFRRLLSKKEETDPALLTMLTGFFSLYIPWIFVTRTTYIYHFFPCVVFVVLMLVRFLQKKAENRPGVQKALWGYMALVFVLFIAYYPVLTGLAVPEAYVQLLRWVPGWVLG